MSAPFQRRQIDVQEHATVPQFPALFLPFRYPLAEFFSVQSHVCRASGVGVVDANHAGATGAWPPGLETCTATQRSSEPRRVGLAFPAPNSSRSAPRHVGCAPSSPRWRPSPSLDVWMSRSPVRRARHAALSSSTRRMRSLPCGTNTIGLGCWVAAAIGRLLGGDSCAAGRGEHTVSVRFPWEEGDTGHVGEDR